ncbi:PhnD/SsuA/transferrin family substrate-binding protein [Paludibacterium sp.]|uniref:phosphate/phosphite/phosphonate ABC transporter substrate-binding protein n=1 Tax=Paludibacterium sp. TaxID=1917523 RepID=UPI0025CD15A0|nr:PhnD/SsuA/transferrin family substrate-binding protein [Paludibacterium sp.]MBV8647148.1 PhnD/SsuA/transferrin family substrate-binding protein [Paludibacterium sp.]
MRRPASWPMYPAAPAWAQRAWWRFLAETWRRAGVFSCLLPPTPTGDLHRHWRHPSLWLSQTCGYPLVTELNDKVQVVGTLCYDAPGCQGIDYRSWLLVRRDDPARALADLRGRVATYNDERSQSGYHSLRAAVAPLADAGRFFAASFASGSHWRSSLAVLAGRADVAAVDCVSYVLLARRHPRVFQQLRAIGLTPAAPGLPLITGRATSAEELALLRASLRQALAAPSLVPARRALHIAGFRITSFADYQRCLTLDQQARAVGMTVL